MLAGLTRGYNSVNAAAVNHIPDGVTLARVTDYSHGSEKGECLFPTRGSFAVWIATAERSRISDIV